MYAQGLFSGYTDGTRDADWWIPKDGSAHLPLTLEMPSQASIVAGGDAAHPQALSQAAPRHIRPAIRAGQGTFPRSQDAHPRYSNLLHMHGPPRVASGLSPHIIQLCSSVVGLLLHQASRSGNRIEARVLHDAQGCWCAGTPHIPRHWGAGCRRVWSNCSQLPGPSLGTLEDARQDWCVRAGAVSHSCVSALASNKSEKSYECCVEQVLVNNNCCFSRAIQDASTDARAG